MYPLGYTPDAEVGQPTSSDTVERITFAADVEGGARPEKFVAIGRSRGEAACAPSGSATPLP
jgi:hypothetical protein